MSKAEKIDNLIDLGLSFDQIVEKEENTSKSFIKGRFTKKGLDWKESVEAEEVQEVVEEKREKASEEALEDTETSGTEEGNSDSGTVSFDFEEPAEQSVGLEGYRSPDEIEAYDIAMTYLEDLANKPVVRRARTGKYIKNVLASLEKGEYRPTELKGINCRYALIAPRPTSINMYKSLHKVQVIMKRIFKNKTRK